MMIIKAGVSTAPLGGPFPQQLSNLIASTATAAGTPAVRDQQGSQQLNSWDTSSIAFRMPASQKLG
jgi:hypothetical protein